MKKKKLLTMLTALVLVAVVGVGATLAYLSDKTLALTNTFTVGNVTINLNEDDITSDNENDRIIVNTTTADTQDYTNMLPGIFVTKDPKINVEAGSSDCYLFMKLDGLDDDDIKENFTIKYGDDGEANEVNPNWHKLVGDPDELDGIYIYEYENNMVFGAGAKTQPIFDSVKYNDNGVETDASFNFDIIAGAYQAGGIDYATLTAHDCQEVINLFN